VATLPAALDAPLFWTPPQLAELAGTQLLQNAAGYDSYVRGTYRALAESAMEGNPGMGAHGRGGPCPQNPKP